MTYNSKVLHLHDHVADILKDSSIPFSFHIRVSYYRESDLIWIETYKILQVRNLHI